LKIYIPQSSVATQLRCGDIYSNRLITMFPQNVPVKKIWKLVRLGEDTEKNLRLTFWPTRY